MTQNQSFDDTDDLFFAGEEEPLAFADEEDSLTFAAEEGQSTDPLDHWKVMIVDDEEEIHTVTKLALDDFIFEDKGLTFLSAYSGQEAKDLILEHPDTAIILLDVVMETDQAGLVVAKFIREDVANQNVRIILRTGQPGQAPEQTVIVNYDINDYKAKTELTTQKLFTTIVTALRSFRDVTSLDRLAQATSKFVPSEFLDILKKESVADVKLGDQIQREMTIMFSDIRDFTALSEEMSPQENFDFINAYLSRVSPHIRAHQGIIDKYIGDAIMALFPDSADSAIGAAMDMQREVRWYNEMRQGRGFPHIQIGLGLHTGNVMLGTIGEANRMEGTVISDAVNLASRIEGLTKLYAASILVSERTLYNLENLTSYHFRFLDKVMVKGKKEPVSVFEIFDGNPPEIFDLKLETRTDFEKGLLHYYSQELQEAQAYFTQVLNIYPGDKAAQLYLQRAKHLIEHGIPDGWDGIESLTDK
ncbi:MAG: adenylate/guanylate cyclase domain-containing protein [Chloroflexota bacterium]